MLLQNVFSSRNRNEDFHPVTFPAKIGVMVDAAALDGTFAISQTAFGMAAAAEKTKDEVPLTVSMDAKATSVPLEFKVD